MTGTSREIRSKSSMVSATPARRAIAIRWMIALVDPHSAMSVTTPLRKASAVRIIDGRTSSHTRSTARRPAATAIRACAECTAGIVAAPVNVIPSASVIDAIVEAVPIVMHVPGEREMPSSTWRIAHESRLPALYSAQYFHTSVPLPRRSVRYRPASIGPAGTKMAGRFIEIAPISSPGTVLSQPPISTTPSIGCDRRISSTSSASRLR